MPQQLSPLVLLVILLLAGNVQAQQVAFNSAGDAVAQGEPPIPQIVSISSIPETMTLGETFELEVRAENSGGLADIGMIALSFPGFTNLDDAQFVSEQPGTSDDSPGFGETAKGQPVRHRDGSTMSAKYLLTEFSDDHWEGSETNALVVRVQPQDLGSFVIQIRVTMQKTDDYFSDPSSGQTDQQGWEVIMRTVTVVAAPEILVSPSSHDYGTVTVDSSASRLFSIENTGGGTLSGNIFIASGGGQYSIVSGGGSFDLISGQSRTVSVRFTPTASGTQSGTFRITHDGSNLGSPIEADLTGVGIVQPQIGVNPGSHDFGTIVVGADSLQTFTIENTSGITLTGDVSVSSGNAHYSIVSGGGNYSLPSGESMEVAVRFAPQSTGQQTGTLQVTHSGSNPGSPIDAPLSGTGIRLPEIAVNPTAHDFGMVTVGEDSAHVFTITNSGGGALKGTIIVLSDGGSFSIDSGGGSYNLSPGQSKSITVLYAPGASGEHAGTLRVLHNGSNVNTPVEATLSGSALLPPTAAVAPTILAFGSVLLGADSTRLATVSNTGEGTLSGSISIANGSDDFSITSGNGTFNLTGGQSVEVLVRFAPSSAGQAASFLQVEHNGDDPVSPMRILLTGSGGVELNDATMVISLDNDTLNFDPSETRATFLISNFGPDTLDGFVSLTNLGMAITDSSFAIDQGAGPFSIAPNMTHFVAVVFNRGGPSGVYEAEVLITHNASNLDSPTRIAVLKTWRFPVATETTPDLGEFGLLPSFPNPASNRTQVTFVLDLPGHASLILYDMLGREVARIIDKRTRMGETTIALPTADLPRGRYMLRLQVGDRSASHIIVVR